MENYEILEQKIEELKQVILEDGGEQARSRSEDGLRRFFSTYKNLNSDLMKLTVNNFNSYYLQLHNQKYTLMIVFLNDKEVIYSVIKSEDDKYLPDKYLPNVELPFEFFNDLLGKFIIDNFCHKMLTVYKVRYKNTGQWSEKNDYKWASGIDGGGSWSKIGNLKNHIRIGIKTDKDGNFLFKNVPISDVEIVPFVIQENTMNVFLNVQYDENEHLEKLDINIE